MALENDSFPLIEDYLDDLLSTDERARFENRIRQDPALRQQLEQQRSIRVDLARLAVKHQVKMMHRRLQEAGRLQATPPIQPVPATPAARSVGRWVYVAAASVILLAFALYWINRPDRFVPLYQAYYAPEGKSRGVTDCPADLKPVITAYRASQYAAALKALPKRNDGCTAYYRGLTLLAQNQPAEAIPALAIARKSAPALLAQQADWYQALALLHEGKVAESRAILRMIAGVYEHPHQAGAEQLLTRL